mmetsp:Transcript_6298/g.12544  ORF Transcript_6298/g.12544 Transcript_6298/m.12544 type:complete len:138 (+) Transcript_6298:765-1178(+)
MRWKAKQFQSGEGDRGTRTNMRSHPPPSLKEARGVLQDVGEPPEAPPGFPKGVVRLRALAVVVTVGAAVAITMSPMADDPKSPFYGREHCFSEVCRSGTDFGRCGHRDGIDEYRYFCALLQIQRWAASTWWKFWNED